MAAHPNYKPNEDRPDCLSLIHISSIVQTFKDTKGYNPTPYLASFFTTSPTIQEQRVKADYWDAVSYTHLDVYKRQQLSCATVIFPIWGLLNATTNV